ncbi:MAG TPA: hypothetical protein PKC30_07075 [Saprospiraceae bacterium]|nr:hypothetical protein [Saprospiraceae bacterium]
MFEGWYAIPCYLKANPIFIVSIAVLVFHAYRNHHDSAKHKHYIFRTSLLILEPILSRIAFDPVKAFLALVWNVLFISFFHMIGSHKRKSIPSVG